MALARFMANPIGRVARIMGGLFLVALGVFTVLGVIAAVLIAIGIVMLLAGAVNFCLISPRSPRPISRARRTASSLMTRSPNRFIRRAAPRRDLLLPADTM